MHMAQLRARMPQLKILVNYNEGPVQTNKYINTKHMIRAISELELQVILIFKIVHFCTNLTIMYYIEH